ncbi:MAG TPA: hypothetical protein VM146_02735 [Steroidobacteraceae bacterium]|nr:hypothetical protein [Steroidobacteraceae bacterium]
MNTVIAARGFTLKQVLALDALTCLVTGAALVAAASPLAGLLGLPPGLLFYAGVVLFPCAALMLLASRTLATSLVWMVIMGNFAWVAASVLVAVALTPTALGFAVILGQAAVVALLGWLELRGR